MDNFEKAVLATQEVILDLASDSNIEISELADKLGLTVDEVSEWLQKPSLSYYSFLKCCSIVKRPAGEIFDLTKKKLTGGKTAKNTDKTQKTNDGNVNNKTSAVKDNADNDDDIVLHDVEVDSRAAGMTPVGDLMLRWSAVMEAISQKTKQPIEKVRGLFDGAPSAVSDNEVYIALKNDNDKTRAVAKKLLSEAIHKAGIIDADKIVINFENS